MFISCHLPATDQITSNVAPPGGKSMQSAHFRFHQTKYFAFDWAQVIMVNTANICFNERRSMLLRLLHDICLHIVVW